MGQYYRIGLFANRDISTTVLAKVTELNESTNCEVLWSTATRKKHDPVYTSRWRETGEKAKQGWLVVERSSGTGREEGCATSVERGQ